MYSLILCADLFLTVVIIPKDLCPDLAHSLLDRQTMHAYKISLPSNTDYNSSSEETGSHVTFLKILLLLQIISIANHFIKVTKPEIGHSPQRTHICRLITSAWATMQLFPCSDRRLHVGIC